MNRTPRLLEVKLLLWQCLSASHTDDLTRSELYIWSALESDVDIRDYMKCCDKEEEYLDIEKWSYERFEFSKDSNKCKTGS